MSSDGYRATPRIDGWLAHSVAASKRSLAVGGAAGDAQRLFQVPYYSIFYLTMSVQLLVQYYHSHIIPTNHTCE